MADTNVTRQKRKVLQVYLDEQTSSDVDRVSTRAGESQQVFARRAFRREIKRMDAEAAKDSK